MELKPIYFSDTTLRDGEQMPGASLEPAEKLAIARELALLGVVNIEVGFPAASPLEAEAVSLVAAEVRGTVVSAFCRALPSDIDISVKALEGADKPGLNLFLATSDRHLEKKLHKTREQVLEMIASAVSYARARCDRVGFGAEDASRSDLEFLARAYKTAIEAGATTVAFPDTLGVLTPAGVKAALGRLFELVPYLAKVPLAVHFHNDLGLATANTLAAVEAGAMILQGTINGLGERAGNAPLEEVAVALSLHPEQYGRRVDLDLTRIKSLSRLVASLTGIPVAPQKAVVGENVFATEAGVHQDGLLKDLDTYLPYRPELVGVSGVRLVLGRHSGRAAFAGRLAELGIGLPPELMGELSARLKAAPKTAWQDPDVLLRNTASDLMAIRGS